MTDGTDLVTTPQQLRLDLQVAAEREIDGVGMGVLSDGTPFLTIRGLARMCGVDMAAIVRMTAAWDENPLKPREQKIRELVRAQGVDDTVAFFGFLKNGVVHHAVPAAVCMAVVEYYAFEARGDSEQAARSYRTLARKGFSDFIYAQVGYNPNGISALASVGRPIGKSTILRCYMESVGSTNTTTRPISPRPRRTRNLRIVTRTMHWGSSESG